MSQQYEQAVIERDRRERADQSWLVFTIIGILVIIVIILTISLFSSSSTRQPVNTEFQKTLFEQTIALRDVNDFLSNQANKDKRFFSKLTKYSNEVYHRFDIISEFVIDKNLLENQKRFSTKQKSYRTKLNNILNKQEKLALFYDSLSKMNQLLPKLSALNTELNKLLFKDNASSKQIYFVTRQLFLIERIKTTVAVLNNDITTGSQVISETETLGHDMGLLIRVYVGLMEGDYKMDVSKISSLKVRNELIKATKMTKKISTEVSIVLEQGIEAYHFVDLINELKKVSSKLQSSYLVLFLQPNAS